MSHTKVLPVQIELLPRAGSWHFRDADFFWRAAKRQPAQVKPLDPWEVRSDFLSLDFEDDKKILDYLNRTGAFGGPESSFHRLVFKVHAEEVRRVMTDKKGLQTDLLNVVGSGPAGTLSAAFLLAQDRTPRLTLTARSSMEAVWLSVFIDKAIGTKFAYCARHDCPLHRAGREPFELKSQHRRLYCSYECAHLVTVRRSRQKGHEDKSTKRTKER